MSSYLEPGTVLGDGKYLLGKKLGAGSHGDVYFGTDQTTEKKIAIKLESWDGIHLYLSHENRVYKELEGGVGFPTSMWFGQELRHNIMVIDLLGPSLDTLFYQCGGQFSLRTVLLLANQILDRVQYLHEKRFIHRSIKPENFVISKDNPNMIYMIDFGNAKKYWNSKKNRHIPFRVYKELGLSNCHSRHQSLGALKRTERSRRDDLESLGYMLVYFLRGSLPWDDVMDDPVELKNIKMNTTVETLCEGCPEEFFNYMSYVRELGFEEEPDYMYLRNIFKGLCAKRGIEENAEMDWVPQQEKLNTRIISVARFENETNVQER